MNRISILIGGLFLGVVGCSLAPSYEKPVAPVAAAWPGRAATSGATPGDPADMDWREFHEDPRLRAIIELALKNNRDLRIAVLRVEQARAQYRIQRADLYPTVDGEASGRRQKYSGAISAFDGGNVVTTYDIHLSASYELDLFGRVRSLKTEALERYLATEEARRSVEIALVSEVASQYLTLQQYREAKAIGQQTLDTVEASYNLNKHSYEAGVASELELQASLAQVQAARVSIANYAQLLAQSENNFVELVGGPLPDDLPPGQTFQRQHLLASLPAGLPSEVLLRRPDLRAAEHTLLAANADIGAARAALYPRILLTGAVGTASASLSDLFSGPSATWSYSPQIIVPIFRGDASRAAVEVSKIGKQIEIANYEKAIQAAFREVANALAVRSILDEKLKAQELLLDAQQKRFDLANARYRQGVDSYLDVLLAQQDLYIARQTLLQFQGARLLNAVALYRSLGGGWKK